MFFIYQTKSLCHSKKIYALAVLIALGICKKKNLICLHLYPVHHCFLTTPQLRVPLFRIQRPRCWSSPMLSTPSTCQMLQVNILTSSCYLVVAFREITVVLLFISGSVNFKWKHLVAPVIILIITFN